MRKLTAIMLVLFIFSMLVNADQKAITNKGDEVVLHDNGTWTYVNKQNTQSKIIKLNKTQFRKSKNATFLVKSKKNNSGFYINPRKWSFKKGVGAKEYVFHLRGKDLSATALTEEIETSIEALANIGFINAKKAAHGVQIIKKEYRIVNGLKVIYMEMKGTIHGIKFMYFTYYYANSSGVTQFIAYTSSNLVAKYRTEIDKILNGLVTQ